MGHDTNQVLMGAGKSSSKTVDNYKGEIAAGLIVRQKSDGTISIAAADGAPLGISMGVSLSKNGRTAVARKGLGIPVLLTDAFSPVVGDQVHISDTTGKAGTAGAGFTGMNAVYKSLKLDAILEDGTTVVDGVAYIDFQGGL